MAMQGIVPGAPVILKSVSSVCQVRMDGNVRFGGEDIELGDGLAQTTVVLPGRASTRSLVATAEGVGKECIEQSYIRRLINKGAISLSPEIVAENAAMLRSLRLSDDAFANMAPASLSADHLLYLSCLGKGSRGEIISFVTPTDIELPGERMQWKRKEAYVNSTLEFDNSLPVIYGGTHLKNRNYRDNARVFRFNGSNDKRALLKGDLPALTYLRPIAVSMWFSSGNQPRFGNLFVYRKMDITMRWILLRSIEEAAGDGANRRVILFDTDKNLHY